jgi:Ca-activated chloride channel family protein
MKKAILFLPLVLFADGIIIPEPLPPQPFVRPSYINVKSHNVKVEIRDNVAQVEITEVFKNPYGYRIEGDYVFPIPEEAVISKFSLYFGDKELTGKIYEREEARKIYEEIVRRLRDPALLEYYRDNLFRARIFPIPPQGEVKVVFKYEQILKRISKYWFLRYPFKIEALTRDPLEDLSITVKIISSNPIKSVFSPTYDVDIVKRSENSVVVAYEAEKIRPQKDFLLYYSVSKEPYDLNLLTFKKLKEEGYFLLSISPSFVAPERPQKKDIVFVLDVSGSMKGKKIESAKKALTYFLRSMDREDGFGIVVFSTDVEAMSDKILYAERENIEDAINFVEKLRAGGGTDIHSALLKALSFWQEGERPFFIVFLTDGKPTAGVTDIGKILEDVKNNLRNARIFVFGVGYEVNTHLLDRLAGISKGISLYVKPEEDLEIVLTDFYDKIAYPALTDLKLEMDEANFYHLYPRDLPDLFYGSEIVIVGKYRKAGEFQIRVEGKKEGKDINFGEEFLFPEESVENSFISRLWAKRRIAHLLDEIRIHGEEKELVEEIVELGKRYGIVTPYTSFLITEEERRTFPHITEKRALKAETGRLAFGAAKTLVKMKREIVATPGLEEFKSVKYVKDRAFYYRNGVWIDTGVKEGMREIKILFGSEEYIELLNRKPEIAPYLSLGTDVKIVVDKVVYHIYSD